MRYFRSIDTQTLVDKYLLITYVHVVGVTGQNVDKPKRRQPKRRQTKTSTNRNVEKPKRRQTEMSANQNVDKPKRRQTKTSTSRNVDKPKRRQTKTSTNQNVDKPERRQTETSTLKLEHNSLDIPHVSSVPIPKGTVMHDITN